MILRKANSISSLTLTLFTLFLATSSSSALPSPTPAPILQATQPRAFVDAAARSTIVFSRACQPYCQIDGSGERSNCWTPTVCTDANMPPQSPMATRTFVGENCDGRLPDGYRVQIGVSLIGLGVNVPIGNQEERRNAQAGYPNNFETTSSSSSSLPIRTTTAPGGSTIQCTSGTWTGYKSIDLAALATSQAAAAAAAQTSGRGSVNAAPAREVGPGQVGLMGKVAVAAAGVGIGIGAVL